VNDAHKLMPIHQFYRIYLFTTFMDTSKSKLATS